MAPFIEADRRPLVVRGQIKEPMPGDLCFLEYRPMILMWKKSPRWTTVDKIYEFFLARRASLRYNSREMRALDLAWQVFFDMHAMPYERKKKAENGEVTE